MTAPHVPEPPVSSAATDGRASRFAATALPTWFGGAGAEVTDPHERGGYAVAGAAVLLFAVVSTVVVAAATAAAHWPTALVVLAALIVLPLTAFGARALATATPPSRGRGRSIGRVAVAVLAGVVIAELASTVLLSGTVHRVLDENAGRDTESASAVVAARTELEQARAERTALDQALAKAQSDIDQALVVARCEYNPTPGCPQTRITGVPGRGPETQTAEDMLADARARLAAAQGRVQPLDDRITDRQQALNRARTTAFDTGDRGLGARWLAMHDYTIGHAGALLLRLATVLVGVLLALLPLLLRWWRGETSFDRRVAARAVVDRAEQDAATAIAVKRAEVRTEAENLRADQELAAARLAVHADTAIDRERQRKRIVAAIGNLEIGITEPARRAVADFESLAELPAAPDNPTDQEGNVTPRNLPAPRTPAALESARGSNLPVPTATDVPAAKMTGGLELPVIGTVPFTDTAARWIRPLVPSFVADAVDTATHPLRTVRQAFEEAEEITFTLRRTRKVTVHSDESTTPSASAPGTPDYAHQVAAQVVDAAHEPPRSTLPPGSSAPSYGLTAAGQRDALPGPSGARELEYRGPRQLPPAPDRG
ncbi:DUF4407 domain-containing protein [Nocardia blacklockiae]|uniref:DUF4407 domain-containing protein n=1 Tax=Nocardia blacklockiae TaxID=480036 RepID=UPI00189571C6|nr:DUF4407 domain-containing protein [Nocardia blacklockiae]MBF6173548.1 DUF4407 domain-containing protein [Nocardia blacklockiae]